MLVGRICFWSDMGGVDGCYVWNLLGTYNFFYLPMDIAACYRVQAKQDLQWSGIGAICFACALQPRLNISGMFQHKRR
eukprot:1505489-Amphidinium_carterae.1